MGSALAGAPATRRAVSANASKATAAPPALRRTPSCKTIAVRLTLTMWTRKETVEDEASGLNLRLAVNVANRLNAISENDDHAVLLTNTTTRPALAGRRRRRRREKKQRKITT